MATLISKFHLRFDILWAMSQSHLQAQNHLQEDNGNCKYFLSSDHKTRESTAWDRCMMLTSKEVKK